MLLLINAILLDLSEEEIVHMFMRNTRTLFHGRMCVVCTMTMGNFPLSSLPKSNYYGWLYVLLACFSSIMEIFIFLMVLPIHETEKSCTLFLVPLDDLLVKCSNTELRKHSLHTFRSVEKLDKISYKIKAKLFFCMPKFLCKCVYTK